MVPHHRSPLKSPCNLWRDLGELRVLQIVQIGSKDVDPVHINPPDQNVEYIVTVAGLHDTCGEIHVVQLNGDHEELVLAGRKVDAKSEAETRMICLRYVHVYLIPEVE